jgi:hypothetical protein
MAKKPKKEPMFRDWNDFINWACGRVLTAFIEEGGKGLRSSIYLVIHTHNTWERELRENDVH